MPQAIFNAVAPADLCTNTTVRLIGGPIFKIKMLTFTKTALPTFGTLRTTSTTGAIKAHEPSEFTMLRSIVLAMSAGDVLPLTINYTDNGDTTLNVTSFTCGTVIRAARLVTLSLSATSANTEETAETATQIYERLGEAQTAIVKELRELKGVLRDLVEKLPPRAARRGKPRGGHERAPRSSKKLKAG